MKLLKTFTDADFGFTANTSLVVSKRQAARLVLFNDIGEVALLCSLKHGTHKLPGGGIEAGESFEQAVKREAIEEAGCEVALQNGEIVQIVEEKLYENPAEFQVSYCTVANVAKFLSSNNLTEDEIAEGMGDVKWVKAEVALKLFEGDTPQTYVGKFMHARDMLFLKYFFNQG